MLELLDPPPELELALAQARIVRLPQVAGDVGVGHAHGGTAGQQRPVLEGLVAAADVGGVGELDVLARQQQLHGAGLQPDQGGAVGILLGAVLAHDVVGPGAGDEAREHRRDLLPVELGIVVLVEQPEPDHRRRHPGHAPDLPLGDRVEHVQHLLGRHPDRLAHTALADIARVGAVEVVGDPAPDPVELDAEDDLVAVRQGLALRERQVLGGQHLQLQRHREPVLRASRPEPEEALAGLEHGARGHGLEAVEVGQAIGIGLVGPGEPEALDLVLERAVLDQARRLDAAADRMRGEARRGVRGVGVGAHQLAGARPLQLAALEHQAVDALAAGAPGDQAALHLGAVEARAEGELARRQEPCRPGDARDQVQGSETFRGVDPDLAHGRAALRAPAARARARRSRGRSRRCRGTRPCGRRRRRAPPRCPAAPSAPRGALPAPRLWPSQRAM